MNQLLMIPIVVWPSNLRTRRMIHKTLAITGFTKVLSVAFLSADLCLSNTQFKFSILLERWIIYVGIFLIVIRRDSCHSFIIYLCSSVCMVLTVNYLIYLHSFAFVHYFQWLHVGVVALHAIAVACPPLDNGECPHLPTRPAKGHVVRIVYGCQTVPKTNKKNKNTLHRSLCTLAKTS